MNAGVQVIKCLPQSTGFRHFLSVIGQVYSPEQMKLLSSSPLETEGLLLCFVVTKDGLPVARAAVYENAFLHQSNKRTLTLGYFESLDDAVIARALLDAVKAFAVSSGFDVIVGPMNASTWNEYRFNLPPLAPPFFTQSFHPSYYADIFVSNDFHIHERYVSAIAKLEQIVIHHDHEAYFKDSGLLLRSILLDRFEEELSRLFALCRWAFAGNPYFSEVTEEDFIRKYLPLKTYLDPEFILLAEGPAGIEGLVFCFPDLYQPKQLIIKTVAKNRQAPKGLISMMTKLIYQTAAGRGFETVIHAYMHVGNPSLRLSQHFSGNVYQEHALFIHHLAS